MCTVRIPPAMRAQTGNLKQVEVEGDTVAAVLDHLVERFPALRERLFGGEGGTRRLVNVYLNNQDIRFLQAFDTPVSPADMVVILPAMAGGAPTR